MIMGNSTHFNNISFRAINDQDQEFLYQVYASTRLMELAVTGWTQEAVDNFLRQQFDFQHQDYMKNYRSAQFDLILGDHNPIGRLYLDRRQKEIRIIDIALLPQFRRQGIGAGIFRDLINEADEHQLHLSLHVETDNPILPFYERLSFKKDQKVQGAYYFMERLPETT